MVRLPTWAWSGKLTGVSQALDLTTIGYRRRIATSNAPRADMQFRTLRPAAPHNGPSGRARSRWKDEGPSDRR